MLRRAAYLTAKTERVADMTIAPVKVVTVAPDREKATPSVASKYQGFTSEGEVCLQNT